MPRITTLLVLSAFSLAALAIIANQTAQAQTFTVIHAFTGAEDGASPWAGLTMDRAGILYGTTTKAVAGTVFQLKPTNGNWILNTLQNSYSVNPRDVRFPLGRVVFGPDGTLYGTTLYGGSGYGTVYNLRPPTTDCKSSICPWTETILYSFTGGADGNGPYQVDPVFDQAGNLYGTTEFGGTDGQGVVFKLTPFAGGWTESVIYSFSGDGSEPASGVTLDSAGNLYGATIAGGRYDEGIIYQLVPSGSGWDARILYTFQGGTDGEDPFGALIFDGSGNLYGTASGGHGAGGPGGTVFKLSPAGGGSWTFSLVYSLSGPKPGCGPSGPLSMDATGNLYDTTTCDGADLNGSVFKLTSNQGRWTYSSLHDFTGDSDGGAPLGGVALDANDNVYGTASQGGNPSDCSGNGCGLIWEITP